MNWQKMTTCVGVSLTFVASLALAPASFAQENSEQDSSQDSRQEQQGEVNLSTTIIGNQEQPKVLYIVPWRAVNAADFENQTIRSQLEMVFGHVEPAEQRRKLKYLKELSNTKQDSDQ